MIAAAAVEASQIVGTMAGAPLEEQAELRVSTQHPGRPVRERRDERALQYRLSGAYSKFLTA